MSKDEAPVRVLLPSKGTFDIVSLQEISSSASKCCVLSENSSSKYVTSLKVLVHMNVWVLGDSGCLVEVSPSPDRRKLIDLTDDCVRYRTNHGQTSTHYCMKHSYHSRRSTRCRNLCSSANRGFQLWVQDFGLVLRSSSPTHEAVVMPPGSVSWTLGWTGTSSKNIHPSAREPCHFQPTWWGYNLEHYGNRWLLILGQQL